MIWIAIYCIVTWLAAYGVVMPGGSDDYCSLTRNGRTWFVACGPLLPLLAFGGAIIFGLFCLATPLFRWWSR